MYLCTGLSSLEGLLGRNTKTPLLIINQNYEKSG